MKSSNWIATYLLKDTLCRLAENKLATTARVFVSALLSFSAILILAGVATESKTVKNKIENLGAHSIVIRSREHCKLTHASSMIPLQNSNIPGILLLKRHLLTASHKNKRNIPIYTYQPNSPTTLPASPTHNGVFCISEASSPQLFHYQHQELIAQPLAAHPPLKPLEREHALLIPEGLYPQIDQTSFNSIALLQPNSRQSFDHLLQKLNQLYQSTHGTKPHIESSQSLLQLLKELENHRKNWRLLLAGLTGGTLALVFGAIAFFMYRENLYVYSLIKSFGLAKKWIFLTVMMENLTIALIGAAAGITTAILTSSHVLTSFGMNSTAIFPKEDIQFLTLCVITAATIASLPILNTLKQPIGEVLS